MTTATEPRTFTDFTWADLPNTGLTRQSGYPLGWMKLHDLAVIAHRDTADFCTLTFAEWRSLVSAAAHGLPIRLTFADRFGHRTSTVIVEQFMSIRPGTTANIYMRTWGFAHPVALRDIVGVEVPSTEYAV